MLSLSLALALLAPLALAQDNHNKYKNHDYLDNMCSPRFQDPSLLTTEDHIAAIAQSPFPCEQVTYLANICFSNGTTPLDFLAEQQCLCGGNYFDAVRGCDECYYAHGFFNAIFPIATAQSRLASASSAECSASPVMVPYTNLHPPQGRATEDASIVDDRFPNDTAVANYWSGATAPVAGMITGSATGRLTSFTNVGGARYTPTGVTEAGAGGGGGGASSTEPASPPSTNGAAEVKAAGGLLAVVIGAVVAL